MSPIVRNAHSDDVDWILKELKVFSEFYGTKKSLFGDDLNYSKTIVSQIIENHLCLISEINSEPVGFICGSLAPHVFNQEIMVLSEVFWWVKPEYRNSRAGALLLNAYIDFGKINADWVLLTLEDKSPLKDQTLLKRGFVLKEKSFLLEVH